MKKEYVPQLPEVDPHSILGISKDSGEEEIRRAYLEKIRQYPPDRSPEEFERIRDAYAVLNNPLHRMRAQLFSVDPDQSLVALLDNLEAKRDFTGPGPWLAAMER
jgi:curved DNA-binding protein CbpA